MTDVAMLLFDGITALDAVGPYEVFQRLPDTRVHMVASKPGPVRTHDGGLALLADRSLADLPSPELVVVPGGFGVELVMRDEATLDWLRRAHETSRFTTSVCTGSLILGAAGILKGLRATSHWTQLDRLTGFGAEPTSERVVFQGKVVTAAGVSAGIDMALALAQRMCGDDLAKGIQLSIEYDPQPPFHAGSPEAAGPRIVETVRRAIEAKRAEST